MAPEDRDGLGLVLGAKVEVKGVTLTVTKTDLAALPRLQDYLIDVAKRRDTVTYAETKDALGLPHAVNGMGRLLDLLTVECIDHQGVPSLAALVVAKRTGEVGSDFDGDPVAERDAVYAHWA